MEPRQVDPTPDAHQRMLERLGAEMFERSAPATEGPIVNHGWRRRGRLVFGDATE